MGEDFSFNETRVAYYELDDGSWKWLDYAEQCPEDVFLLKRCQGVKGHKGVHWAYDESGSFCYEDNKDDSTENGYSGSIPPEHKDYRTPISMREHYHLNHTKVSPLVDEEIIARIKKRQLKNGESLDRPYRGKLSTTPTLKHRGL